MSQPFESQQSVLLTYQQNIRNHSFSIQKLKKAKRWIAAIRLATVLTGSGLIWYFWPSPGIISSVFIIFTVLLILLIFRDTDHSNLIAHFERLISVNNHEIDAIQYSLRGYDGGNNFSDPNHDYASDLDLFGESSLFQWINRCHADQSKKLLSDHLKYPLPLSAIRGNQEAAKELAGKWEDCQQFQSTAMANPLTMETERKLERWMAAPSPGYKNPFWKWFPNIYPVIPAGLITVYAFDMITVSTFLLFLVALNIFHYLLGRKIIGEFTMLLNIEPEMDALYKQLHLIEMVAYTSRYIQSLQARLKPDQYSSASMSIKDFNSILKKINWRSNLLINALLQLFLFWDLRLFLLLKEWKKKNQNFLNGWFVVIAEMEVAISLASLVRNEPGWCFPELDDQYFHFNAVEIGHPLIPPDKRITNDFMLEGRGKIALVTGSNMAGKSTFLRSLGVNTVLAQMGCPVCARQMKLGVVKLISSMRVADNLAENTSTFYAELKKLHIIIEAVNRKENVLILLDEVLRGTNSTDRHNGSQALVRQLLQNGAVAVMATHDTDLARSEAGADKSVSNYHFEGRIIDDELFFDYKIKNGICESLNATTLLKNIGIQFQD
jgi:hypothetical protein